MSLVSLQRVAIVGRVKDRDDILRALQHLGRMHVVLEEGNLGEAVRAPNERSEQVLRELEQAPQQRRALRHWGKVPPSEVEADTLRLREERLNLDDERDQLEQARARLRPWGQFERPTPGLLGDLQLWFYAVPHYKMPELEALPYPRKLIARDNVAAYVVLLSAQQPENTPVDPLQLGEQSLPQVQARLERIDERLDEINAERAALTRYLDLLRAYYLRQTDIHTLATVRAASTLPDERLFVVHGYWPTEEWAALEGLREHFPLALVPEPVPAEETPPTLLSNRGLALPGQTLVQFYALPAASAWDPSGFVMLAFALFFAMILSDAGYALLLAVITLMFSKRLRATANGRVMRRLLFTLSIAAGVWGVAVGSYFGIAPAPGSLLSRLAYFDLANAEQMMAVSIWVGALHMALANVRRAAWLWGDGRALAALGWCGVIAAGLCAWQGLQDVGWYLLGLGAVLVVGWTAPHEKPLMRLLGGLKGLTGITGAFGDALSYLRLFALGLASASLAGAFNDLAADAASGTLGLASAALILLVGHALNLALGIMGGFVHGLRLNFIEFFKWGLEGEGRPYTPFQLQGPAPEESERWNSSS